VKRAETPQHSMLSNAGRKCEKGHRLFQLFHRFVSSHEEICLVHLPNT
jgi:hypothetical protein